MPARGPGVVSLFPLFTNHLIRSQGGGTGWSYELLDLPHLRDILPYAAALKVHGVARQTTAAAEWKLVFYWSFDGNEWTGPFDLHTALAADASFIGAAYTTTANFGRIARFAIASRASAGTNQEGAVASEVLEVTWRS